ncbi:MAG: TetR/AcrR family transcriptional regulator [Actinomycetota bacterium]
MSSTAPADGQDTAPPESRRQRQRRELTAEIIAIARRQLADGGRAGVSWRGIAREVGMNPASLYTYFASLDELFTAMILESYGGLADALDAALTDALGTRPDDGPGSLLAVTDAYRSWAIDNPAQYNLIFTDQIPGYAAPQDAGTVEAEVAVLRPLVRAFGLALGQDYSIDGGPDGAPPGVLDHMLSTWGVLHGLVALEINNHLPFVDDRSDLLTDAVLRVVGVDRHGSARS